MKILFLWHIKGKFKDQNYLQPIVFLFFLFFFNMEIFQIFKKKTKIGLIHVVFMGGCYALDPPPRFMSP